MADLPEHPADRPLTRAECITLAEWWLDQMQHSTGNVIGIQAEATAGLAYATLAEAKRTKVDVEIMR